jgi:hypothetical protein
VVRRNIRFPVDGHRLAQHRTPSGAIVFGRRLCELSRGKPAAVAVLRPESIPAEHRTAEVRSRPGHVLRAEFLAAECASALGLSAIGLSSLANAAPVQSAGGPRPAGGVLVHPPPRARLVVGRAANLPAEPRRSLEKTTLATLLDDVRRRAASRALPLFGPTLAPAPVSPRPPVGRRRRSFPLLGPLNTGAPLWRTSCGAAGHAVDVSWRGRAIGGVTGTTDAPLGDGGRAAQQYRAGEHDGRDNFGRPDVVAQGFPAREQSGGPGHGDQHVAARKGSSQVARCSRPGSMTCITPRGHRRQAGVLADCVGVLHGGEPLQRAWCRLGHVVADDVAGGGDRKPVAPGVVDYPVGATRLRDAGSGQVIRDRKLVTRRAFHLGGHARWARRRASAHDPIVVATNTASAASSGQTPTASTRWTSQACTKPAALTIRSSGLALAKKSRIS